MKSRIRALTLTVTITTTLLVAAGVLVVLGIFNDMLNWDLFGPKLQAILYGVFGSCIALSFIGVGLTLVLGTQEIVTAFRALKKHVAAGEAESPEAPRRAYWNMIAGLVAAMAVLILVLAGINRAVQVHRSNVFKKLVAEQMDHFGEKMGGLVGPLDTPPRDQVPYEIYDLVKTLDNLSFVNRATLYLPDPEDDSAMWGYTAWRDYKPEDGFARFFVAKDFEKAMRDALDGDPAALDGFNEDVGFVWYYVVEDAEGEPVATLRVDGNSRENFREYFLGS